MAAIQLVQSEMKQSAALLHRYSQPSRGEPDSAWTSPAISSARMAATSCSESTSRDRYAFRSEFPRIPPQGSEYTMGKLLIVDDEPHMRQILAMAMGPEFREDPASISPEERARRAKLLTHQRAQP